MENITAQTGLTAGFTAHSAAQPPALLWRPWVAKGHTGRGAVSHMPYSKPAGAPDVKESKTPQITHPVKLFWPRSRCFDYLYQDAEMLLRNYPVQATICLYEDSDSEDEEDSDEEDEKELN